MQDDCELYGFDAFYEQPINEGEQGVTLQFDWNHVDGGTFLTDLPKQDNILAEAAYHFGKVRLSPFVQYAAGNFAAQAADEPACQRTEGQPDRTQALLQF